MLERDSGRVAANPSMVVMESLLSIAQVVKQLDKLFEAFDAELTKDDVAFDLDNAKRLQDVKRHERVSDWLALALVGVGDILVYITDELLGGLEVGWHQSIVGKHIAEDG